MKEQVKYCECMEQILHRVGLVINYIDKGETLGNQAFDYELIALNFRKILELIAFSSLVAHQEAYKESYKNAQKDWSAEKILSKIEDLNPDFYPQPRKRIIQSDGTNHLDFVERDFLTRKEFKRLYKKCGEVLHVKNILLNDQSYDFLLSPKEWLEKITALLDNHIVNILGTDEFWFVEMRGADGRVHVYSLGKLCP